MVIKNEIDVHVLFPSTWTIQTATWRDECMASLAGHPINVHQLSGIPGNLRQARFNGYSMGTAPYISFVDPDDVVHPGAFASALNTLIQAPSNICGAYTNYNMLSQYTGERRIRQLDNKWSRTRMISDMRLVHQIVVMKRDIVLPVYVNNWNSIPNIGNELFCLAILLAKQYNWIADPIVGYTWRIHAGGVHQLIHQERFSRHHVLLAQQWALRELGLPVWEYHSIHRFFLSSPLYYPVVTGYMLPHQRAILRPGHV